MPDQSGVFLLTLGSNGCVPDQGLQFIDEHDYPGVSELRRQNTALFSKDQVSSIPHTEVMATIDQAGSRSGIGSDKTAVRSSMKRATSMRLS